jgi:hypothetical protein
MGLLDRLELVQKDAPESNSEDAPEFAQDPEPGERPRRKARKTVAPVTPRKPAPTVARMAKEVGEDLASLIEMGAAVWGMTDECCTPVLEQQAKPIAEAFTAILSRNPRLLASFANTDLVAYALQGGMLFKALKPVAQTVYRNHVSKAHNGEEGQSRDGVNLGIFPAYAGNGAR